MLPPVGFGSYAKVHESSDNRDMQGLFIYHDKQRSSICHADVVYGSDKSFSKRFKDNKSKSKGTATELAVAYPLRKPLNPEAGGWKGIFDDLSMHAVIAIEPNVDDVDDVDGVDGVDGDDCLTQTDGGGLFVWSAATLQKLDAVRIAGVTTLKEKQIVFALRMLQFTYELMMKRADCVPSQSHPFKPFIGRAVVLQNNRDARAGAPTSNT